MAKHVYVKFGVLAASVFEILSKKKTDNQRWKNSTAHRDYQRRGQ